MSTPWGRRNTKENTTKTLLLIPPVDQRQLYHYCDRSQVDQEKKQGGGGDDEEGHDKETPLPVTFAATNASRYFLGPRKVLRALSVPLSERSPLLVTRHDDDDDDNRLSKPRVHSLLRREAHVSTEKLNPHAACASRKSTVSVALFNLVATVCGGGVLSLPLVFSRCGIVPTTILMILGALGTDASLQRLVDSSRTTGGRSYGDVAQAAFGKAAQVVTTLTLAIMLVGSLIAYFVLTRDVWAPVIFTLVPGLQRLYVQMLQPGHTITLPTGVDQDGFHFVDRRAADLLLLTILVLALPLMLQRELYALRHTCYVGFGSCILLAVAVVTRAAQRVWQEGTTLHLLWWSHDIADWLFAFPIIALCFFCSYNCLPVHAQLFNPTRERIGWVLRTSMIICFTLFYIVGLCGYIYASPYTPDNIISAFPMQDMYVLAGRMGYCLTLLFGVPLILLPCRDAWTSLPTQLRDWRMDQALIAEFERKNESSHDHLVVNGVDFDESHSFSRKNSSLAWRCMSSSDEEQAKPSSVHCLTKERSGLTERTEASPQSLAESGEDDPTSPQSRQLTLKEVKSRAETSSSDEEACECPDKLSHWATTLALLTMAYVTAISVPGVASVWSIFGSSMALFIAFVVPAACYLQIHKHKGRTGKAFFAAILLILSMGAMISCTRQAVANAIYGTRE